jgi:hypothetical protein
VLTKNRFLTFEKETQSKLMEILPLADIFCPYYPSDRAKGILPRGSLRSLGTNPAIRRKVDKIF